MQTVVDKINACNYFNAIIYNLEIYFSLIDWKY